MKRRTALKTLAISATSIATVSPLMGNTIQYNEQFQLKLKGNIKHSLASWTYNFLPLNELCALLKKMGVPAIDLIAPKDFETVKKHKLQVSMCYTNGKTSLTEGWNNTKYHDALIKDYTEAIPIIKNAGYKNLICFSGNRNGMDDNTGLQNCVNGLKKILPLAEQNGITIVMELFNSKIDHKDYMCDKTAWGVELCKQLNSNNFKLLYDIYHMQINEGDVIRTIKDFHPYFAHYHTAGVPGRNEINETQELNYPAIMKAIVATGYTGYVAQEFIPSGKTNDEKIKALKQAFKICDV